MDSPIATVHYAQITSDINALLSTNRSAKITIFTSQDGAVMAQDSASMDINARTIASISYTASYVDSVSGETVNGFLTITFSDSSTFKAIDDLDHCWYSIQGSEFALRELA